MKKFLSYFLFFSCTSFFVNNSYASTDLDRYEYRQGNSILIDTETLEGLKNVEILGNYIESENGVEFLGELLVDKKGDAILDSNGNKQYKVDLSFKNGRIDFQGDSSRDGKYYFPNAQRAVIAEIDGKKVYRVNGNYTGGRMKLVDKYQEGQNITIRGLGALSEEASSCFQFIVHYTDKTTAASSRKLLSTVNSLSEFKYTTPKNGKTIDYISFDTSGVNSSYIDIESIEISYGDKILEDNEERIQSIIIPQQLKRIGDVCDRLYWSDIYKEYVIEENIGFNKMDINSSYSSYHNYNFTVGTPGGQKSNSKFIIENNDGFIKGVTTYGSTQWVYISCEQDYVDKHGILPDSGSLANYAKSKGMYGYYYERLEPKIVKTGVKRIIPSGLNFNKIQVEGKSNIYYEISIMVDVLYEISKDLVQIVEESKNSSDLEKARRYVNELKESILKDQLQKRLNSIISFNDLTMEKKTSTANLDVYIKSENLLSLSLSSNIIMFEDFTGIDDLEQKDALELTVNSSLPYEINTYLENEIYNADKSEFIGKDILSIRESNGNYETFDDTKTNLTLLPYSPPGNGKMHSFDFRLNGGIANKNDAYKAVVKFEINQK